jgi:hypothetical protein
VPGAYAILDISEVVNGAAMPEIVAKLRHQLSKVVDSTEWHAPKPSPLPHSTRGYLLAGCCPGEPAGAMFKV